MDKNKIIALQDKRIEDLEQKVKEWEDWKASSKERHTQGEAFDKMNKADQNAAKATRKRKK